MAKDPAFLFYSSDFLTGTMFMTNEQIGLYVRMLCAQHQHGGRIDTNVLRTQCDCITGGDTVYNKFTHDASGSFNERLSIEMDKRKEKSQKARESVEKRWNKAKYDSNTNVLRSEDVNENENRTTSSLIKKDKIEISVENEKLKTSLSEFMDHRKSKKAPIKTQLQFDKFLKSLRKLSGDNPNKAVEILDQSIANGWTGIFAVDRQNQNGYIDKDKISVMDYGNEILKGINSPIKNLNE